jgi:hypothetical protein
VTLVLAVGNASYTVLVADRRLTRVEASGKVTLVDEESNKAAVLTTKDARVAVAFTGLATVGVPRGHQGPPPPGGFRTAWWIVESLGECVKTDQLLLPTLERFRLAAEAKFSGLNVREKDRVIAMVIAGYTYGDAGGSQVFHRTLSNMQGDTFQAHPGFVLSDPDPGSAANYMMAAGARAGIEDDDVAFLAELVDDPSSRPGAVVARAVHTIRSVASRSASRNLVGPQCTSVILPADPSRPAESGYHTATGSPHVYGVNEVRAHDDVLLVMDPKITGGIPGGELSPIAGPKIGRDKPCWCGSGKKFKKCHGA